MMSNSTLMLLLELSGPKLVSILSLSSISFQMTELFKSFTFLWIQILQDTFRNFVGFCQNWCATTHFYIFGLNLRNEDWGGGTKVYIFGKISLLGVQKFQNQSHMSYKRKAFVTEA